MSAPTRRFGIALLAIAVYATALPNGFVQDDALLILGNESLHSLANLPGFFATDLFQGTYPAASYYRPLVLASFALEYALAGPAPLLFHLTNVLLHALACVLLLGLCERCFASQRVALVSAALFAVHPVHTEVVAAIYGRGDLLATVFILAAAQLHTGPRGPTRTLLELVCVALALLSKEGALVGLALLPLTDLARDAHRARPLRAALAILRERAPLWAGLLLVIALYAWARSAATASGIDTTELGFMADRQAGDTPLALKFATCAKLVGIYLKLLAFPWVLSADYDYAQIPVVQSAVTLSSLLPPLLWVGMVAVALGRFGRDPALGLGLGFTALSLVALCVLLPFANIPLAERYLYLPSVGWCIAVAAVMASLPLRPTLSIALVLLVVVPASVRTAVRNRDWRDDHALWAATAMTSPNSAKAQANRALSLATRAEALQQEGRGDAAATLFAEAAMHYERALAIDPLRGPTRMQYALCLGALGRPLDAERELRAASAQGVADAPFALHRMLLDAARQRAQTQPASAEALLGRARSHFDEEIRPRISLHVASVLDDELRQLARDLRER